jgi:hypothetical protein
MVIQSELYGLLDFFVLMYYTQNARSDADSEVSLAL